MICPYHLCCQCAEHLKFLSHKLSLSDKEFDLLQTPQNIIKFQIPLKRDNGEQVLLDAFRVQYNNALGPFKGGVRFHQDVHLDEVKLLAFLMALKCALLGLPFGGGKGGVRVNPAELSAGELERLSRGYMQGIFKHIGPKIDVPAPDVGTNSQIMAIMSNEYAKLVGRQEPAVITGKPVGQGGSLGREKATAMGGFYILSQVVKPPAKIVIQGFGNVGGNLAKIAVGNGYKVIGLSNCHSAVYNPDGLNINPQAVYQHDCQLPEVFNGKAISNEELLGLECDVLAPSAVSHQITKENVNNVKAKIILEMANAPLTPEADKILNARGVKIIPDILANAGGVVVSYFEWLQNLNNEQWAEEKVFSELKKKMNRAFVEVWEVAKIKNCDLRTAADILAINKILTAEKRR